MKVAKLQDYRKKNSAYNQSRCREDFSRFLEEEEKSPHTIKNYLCDLDAFMRWFESNQDEQFSPDLITAADLREYKRHLEKTHKPLSINRKLSTIRTFLNWAADTGILQSVPRVPKPVKEKRPGIKWLERLEQHALLRRVERGGLTRDLAVVKLLLNTGLRVSELCALVWSDVTITPKKGTLTVRSGQGSKRREIPLNKDAREALLSLGYQDNAGTDSPILWGQRGTLSPRGVQTMLEKYKGDLENCSPHSLRHSFCKNLVDAGVGLEKVAALAGHENLETTRRYCEPSHDDLQKAVELIGEQD